MKYGMVDLLMHMKSPQKPAKESIKKHTDKILNCEGSACETENDLAAQKQLIHKRISLLLFCDQCDFKISRKTDFKLYKRLKHLKFN